MKQSYLLSVLLAALAFTAACDRKESRLQVTYNGRQNSMLNDLQIEVLGAGASESFHINQDLNVQFISPAIRTDASKYVSVSFVMKASSAEFSRGVVELQAKPDWEWNVNFSVDTISPAYQCFGCFGSKSFPIAAAFQRSAKDSVWAVWGGNSISNPVVY